MCKSFLDYSSELGKGALWPQGIVPEFYLTWSHDDIYQTGILPVLKCIKWHCNCVGFFF